MRHGKLINHYIYNKLKLMNKIWVLLILVLETLNVFSQNEDVYKLKNWKYSFDTSNKLLINKPINSEGVLYTRYMKGIIGIPEKDSSGMMMGCMDSGTGIIFIIFKDSISVELYLKNEVRDPTCEKICTENHLTNYKLIAGKFFLISVQPCSCFACNLKTNFCDLILRSILNSLPSNPNTVAEILKSLPIKEMKVKN